MQLGVFRGGGACSPTPAAAPETGRRQRSPAAVKPDPPPGFGSDEQCDAWIKCYDKLTSIADMKKQYVYDPLISKRQQLLLATQVVRMILRVDDVITSVSFNDEL